ncbi:hypothetical protein [Mesorhizobium loti]|uniref:Uncharacterized protein n=1 Tax=Mesorhizobium loti R88b TaxID=935548 RepID=A0A6M7WEM4_RHILI|nr:hypothetical protein [Mesorhizobium loti]QKD00326.1 hypothetical protein EB235_01610 [Mesorhizobium loti R88b]
MTAFPEMTNRKREIAKGLVLLVLAGLCCGPALGAGPNGASLSVPDDVRAFIDRRDGCDHFRGEDSPDAERRAQIDAALRQLCTGTDAELARLKRVYAGNPDIQRLLDDYEIDIEIRN